MFKYLVLLINQPVRWKINAHSQLFKSRKFLHMPHDLTFKNFVFACIFCVFSLIPKANIHCFPKNY